MVAPGSGDGVLICRIPIERVLEDFTLFLRSVTVKISL